MHSRRAGVVAGHHQGCSSRLAAMDRSTEGAFWSLIPLAGVGGTLFYGSEFGVDGAVTGGCSLGWVLVTAVVITLIPCGKL